MFHSFSSIKIIYCSLIDAGYNIEEIGEAILDVEKSKRERILSVRSTGWNVPLDFVSGAAKVTGTALHVAAKTTGTAVVKVGRRSSKILKESVNAAIAGLNLKPRRKSITTTAA